MGSETLNRDARDAVRRLELALTSPDAATVERVRVALGFSAGWRPRRHLGETATYLTVWSQMELNDLFQRVGGTVTTRQVERSIDDGRSTWTATEITLTVDVPDVGPVEVVTDIEDDPEHGYRTDVPVVLAANQPVPSDPAAVAALHRLEARLAGLRRGESTVINGVTCTAVSLRDADLLDRYDWVSACCRRKSATAATSADFDRLLCLQDELAVCRRELVAAGLLHLIGGA